MPAKNLLKKELILHRFIFCMSLCILFSCKTEPEKTVQLSSKSSTSYAKGFDIIEGDGFRTLLLFRHYQKTTDTLRYLLYTNEENVPEGNFQGKIQVPVNKAIALSSPYSAMMESLGGIAQIIAIPQAAYIYSPALLRLIEEEKVLELGPEVQIDIESTLNLKPDILMYSAFPGGVSRNIEQLESLGVPCLPLAEWQENTLLGRAEWVKVIGSLLDKKPEADSLFAHISSVYQNLKGKITKSENKPLLLSGLPFKGIWSVPGGDSYMAHVFADAGASYHWQTEHQTTSLPLSFEAVYPIGLKAEIWVGPGSVQSYNSLIAQDDRFLDFLAYKQKKIYHYYQRANEQGGNDYWESGVINPHLILSDLIKIVEPELLPDHEFVYFGELAE